MTCLRAEITLAPKGQIIVTQQMRVALGILQAPLGELRGILREAWTTNPFLEADPAAEEEESIPCWDRRYGEGEGHAWVGGTEGGATDEEGVSFGMVALGSRGWEDGSWAERMASDRGSWQVGILAQYRLENREPGRVRIAEYLLGSLDYRGYLMLTVQEVSKAVGRSMGEVETVRQWLLHADPPGLAARSLGECLGAQLSQAGRAASLAAAIAAEDIERLARRRFAEIAARHGVTVEAVQQAAQEIRGLRPHPAAGLGADGAEPVVPDIIVEHVGSEYEVLINDRLLPGLRIVPPGTALLHADDPRTRAFVAEHLAGARWLLGSLDARRRTLVALMRRILEEQRGFFDRGVEALKPLGYRRVATALGLHESTIARAVRGKTVQTPRGVFPVRFFFTHGLSADCGEAWTPAAVARRIREMVGGEDPGKPLSDEMITRGLRQDGVCIARRTVAKYRDRLGIPRAMFRGGF
ncbi:MAG: RNA polymerase factor sigma-54 [Candidatus Eisenbacteria bacterium]